MKAAGLDAKVEGDDAVLTLDKAASVTSFLERCAKPRKWDRPIGV